MKFKSDILIEAVSNTFNNRSTNIVNATTIFNENFSDDSKKQALWEAFLKRNNIEEELTFSEVLIYLEKFFQPVLYDDEQNKIWDPHLKEWKRE